MKRITGSVLIILLIAQCGDRHINGSGISLTSATSFPSETIIINLGKEKINENNSVQVTFNDKKAHIVAVDGNSIEVMVPELISGEAKVIVSINKKAVGKAILKIAAHPSRKLVFLMDHKGSIKQINEKLTNDELAAYDDGAGRKIAFELINEKQEILVSGTVVHPMTDMEIFDDNKNISRAKVSTNSSGGIFSITVPNIKEVLKLRLYDVTLSGDANNEKMLAGKKLITEINLLVN